MEADKNGDGIVTFEEFQGAMGNILRKTIKKKRATSQKWGKHRTNLALTEPIQVLYLRKNNCPKTLRPLIWNKWI